MNNKPTKKRTQSREFSITDIEYHADYVFLRVNNKPYRYKFGEGYKLNREIFESYYITFGKNKGRFLAKIRQYLMKETEEQCTQQS